MTHSAYKTFSVNTGGRKPENCGHGWFKTDNKNNVQCVFCNMLKCTYCENVGPDVRVIQASAFQSNKCTRCLTTDA